VVREWLSLHHLVAIALALARIEHLSRSEGRAHLSCEPYVILWVVLHRRLNVFKCTVIARRVVVEVNRNLLFLRNNYARRCSRVNHHLRLRFHYYVVEVLSVIVLELLNFSDSCVSPLPVAG